MDIFSGILIGLVWCLAGMVACAYLADEWRWFEEQINGSDWKLLVGIAVWPLALIGHQLHRWYLI